jgi:hypothetical protein
VRPLSADRTTATNQRRDLPDQQKSSNIPSPDLEQLSVLTDPLPPPEPLAAALEPEDVDVEVRVDVDAEDPLAVALADAVWPFE